MTVCWNERRGLGGGGDAATRHHDYLGPSSGIRTEDSPSAGPLDMRTLNFKRSGCGFRV